MVVPVPLTLPATLYDRLDAMARAKGLSVTLCVREAIERRLSQYEDALAREAVRHAPPARGPDTAGEAFQRPIPAAPEPR